MDQNAKSLYESMNDALRMVYEETTYTKGEWLNAHKAWDAALKEHGFSFAHLYGSAEMADKGKGESATYKKGKYSVNVQGNPTKWSFHGGKGGTQKGNTLSELKSALKKEFSEDKPAKEKSED